MLGSIRRLLHTSQTWGVVDQGFSSATNLGLSIVAARLLHATGLGIVFVGFSAYLFALAAQRALVTDPLTVHAASLNSPTAHLASRRGLAMALSGSAAMTAVCVCVGIGIGGRFGHGVLIFTPWLAGALLQDFWRTVLFRAGRGAAAALNDGAWAIVMAAAIPFAWWLKSEWLVVSAWGIGATVGALLGFLQLRIWTPAWGGTWTWWRREVLPFGRWLGLESMCIASVGLIVPFLLVTTLSAKALGGLRAVDAIFSPMTLVGQGLELPWLPQLARIWDRSQSRARSTASKVSALALVLLSPYLVFVLIFGSGLLGTVFGSSFRPFAALVLPVAVSEIFFAATLGFLVLLKAARRGRARLVSRLIASVNIVSLVGVLAATGGLLAAVWGRTIGIATGETMATVLALQPQADPGTMEKTAEGVIARRPVIVPGQ